MQLVLKQHAKKYHKYTHKIKINTGKGKR